MVYHAQIEKIFCVTCLTHFELYTSFGYREKCTWLFNTLTELISLPTQTTISIQQRAMEITFAINPLV